MMNRNYKQKKRLIQLPHFGKSLLNNNIVIQFIIRLKSVNVNYFNDDELLGKKGDEHYEESNGLSRFACTWLSAKSS